VPPRPLEILSLLTARSPPWQVRHVPPSCMDSSTERFMLLLLLASGKGDPGPGIAVTSVTRKGRRPETLMVHLLLRPKRKSGWNRLPMVGAFSVAHGIRKTTGVVAWIQKPGKIVVEDRTVGKAFFSRSKRSAGSADRSVMLLGLRVNCTIESEQLGDLLLESPWPKNTLFMDPNILLEKILESFDWVYSEWERGMDRTLDSRLRTPLPFNEAGTQ
jgi:hypothetical protein